MRPEELPQELTPARFGERLARAVTARESPLVLGLDPDPGRLWPEAQAAAGAGTAATRAAVVGEEPRVRAARAVEAQCRALVDAAGPACVAVKPQLACFERLGAAGWAVLERTCVHARAAGLLVLADAKRGDIGISAAAYGQAFFGSTPTPWGDVPGLGVDALTASPLLGADSLGPLLAAARAVSGGLFVLVRTSNPGARDVQELALSGGGDVAERLAILVAAHGEAGPAGIADVGAVVGATVPERLARLRDLAPAAPFLLPGIGAQGGRVEDLAPAWAPGPAGGLVTASRAIARAHEEHGGEPRHAARRAAEDLRARAWELALSGGGARRAG